MCSLVNNQYLKAHKNIKITDNQEIFKRFLLILHLEKIQIFI